MGLHNANDWRYNQKPGNLFSTYLGKAPSPDPPAGQTRRRRPPTRRVQPAPVPTSPADALLAFFQYNATVSEVNQFLRLTADHKRVAVTLSKRPWRQLRRFADTYLSEAEIEHYLAELKRRRRAGEPLIRRPS